MKDPRYYNINVRLGDFEGETCFEARVKELPDLIEYGDTYEEAYELALDSIETTSVIFAEKNKAMPIPYQIEDTYSGRVTLRLPKSLHRNLASRAEIEGVSLNHYLVTILSNFSGFNTGIYQSRWHTMFTLGEEKASTRPKLKLISEDKIDYSAEWQEKDIA